MKRIEPWWNVFPFVRLLPPFLSGIIFPGTQLFILPAAAAILIILARLSLKLVPIYLQYRLRFIRGISLHLILFVFGKTVSIVHDLRNHNTWFANHPYEQLLLKTTTEPRLNKWGYTINASVIQRCYQNQWYRAIGKINIRISGTNRLLYPGSILTLDQPVEPPVNSPGSKFDYQRYLANLNIHHQVSIRSTNLQVIRIRDHPEGYINRFRLNILSLLDRSFSAPSEKALAKALLVGERAELERSLVDAYTNTGVIHVIAISGLHLGLIYALLLIVFKPLAGDRKSKIVVNVLVAAALWVFTLICGASPSVVRSAVMFSSLLLGDSIGSDNNTGNALASSAFLLLCYDPNLLNDIGFQLSYAAVASLLIYNRALTSIFRPQNGILAFAWGSISTSISAQILTTPLVLIHFHQFPIVFILSNLVAVPVSGMILILLILLCFFQFIPAIVTAIGCLASLLIRFMNEQVTRIASLPFASWENISFKFPDLVFSFLTIFLFSLFTRTRSPRALILFLLTILTWLISNKYSIR